MKRLILCSLFIPFAGNAGFYNAHHSSTNLIEVRTGDWPITLEKNTNSTTPYSLQFRNQQVMKEVVMDTLAFSNLEQLKYFEKALTTLKTAHDGDIAKFKDYSIKRAEKKYEGVWYILRLKWSSTDFRQPEADLMINTIRNL